MLVCKVTLQDFSPDPDFPSTKSPRSFTFRTFNRRFCAAMQGADQHIRSSLGFSMLPKDTLTCRPGELNQRTSNNKMLALPQRQVDVHHCVRQCELFKDPIVEPGDSLLGFGVGAIIAYRFFNLYFYLSTSVSVYVILNPTEPRYECTDNFDCLHCVMSTSFPACVIVVCENLPTFKVVERVQAISHKNHLVRERSCFGENISRYCIKTCGQKISNGFRLTNNKT